MQNTKVNIQYDVNGYAIIIERNGRTWTDTWAWGADGFVQEDVEAFRDLDPAIREVLDDLPNPCRMVESIRRRAGLTNG